MAAGPDGGGGDRVDSFRAKGDIHPREGRLSTSKDTDRDQEEDRDKDRDRDRGRDRDHDRYRHLNRDRGRDRDRYKYRHHERDEGRDRDHNRYRRHDRDEGRDRDHYRYRDQEPRVRHHHERKEYRDHPDDHDHYRGRDSERSRDHRRGGHWRHRSHSRSHSRGRDRRSGSRSCSKSNATINRRRERERDGHHSYRSRSRSHSRGRDQRSRSHSHSRRQRDRERDWNTRHCSRSRSRDRDHRSRSGSHSKSQYAANVTSVWEEANKLENIHSPRRSPIRSRKMKLLILDLNGLLAAINRDQHNTQVPYAKFRGQFVFKRPYCDDFLRFCFHNFHIGIWSSRLRENVESVVNILMKDLKQHLLFCWDLSKCTATGFNTLENKRKPLVLKELKKLWNKEEPDLPWKKGWFSPSNTLLVDDSPYKALRNPPYTAIFPFPYSYKNEKDDSLGPGGDLRLYLENLASASDVQHYVKEHPFGQPPITQEDPHWDFYVQMLEGRT